MMDTRVILRLGLTLALATATGCDGLIALRPVGPEGTDSGGGPDLMLDGGTSLGGDGSVDGGTGPLLDGAIGVDAGPVDRGPPIGESRLALISREEYAFSVRDVFAVNVPTADLPQDYLGAIRFVDNHQQPLQETMVEQYEDVAWELAETLATGAFPASDAMHPGERRLDILLQPVTECTTRNAACAVAVATRYGARLYRRPLVMAELDAIRTLFQWTVRPGTAPDFTDGGSGTFVDGIRVVLATLLQAPDFIFHVEHGEAGADPDVLSVDGYTRAARLASFIWRSVPDDTLMNAARDGMLSTPAQVEEQARRMLADTRADRMWSSLARGWLISDPVESDHSDDRSGDGELWTSAVAQAAGRDVRQFIIHIARNDGTIEELFTSSGGVSQGATLQWIIGVSGTEGEWVASIPNRHGILTLPGVMAANNHSGFTSALIRGLFMRQSILCQAIQGPPPGIEDLIAMARMTMPDLENPTRREHLAAVTQSGEPCSSCHQYTNDVGFAFAAFDDFGRFQTSELTIAGPVPVDASGWLRPVPGSPPTTADGAFANHVELIDRLATSPTVARCMARQVSRLGLGRDVALGDEDSLDQVMTHIPGGQLTELIVAVATSDSFLSRRVPHPVAP